MTTIFKRAGAILLWAIVVAALAAVIVPRFLDRRYYVGPAGGHYDGARFLNPDGEDTARAPGRGGRGGFLWRQATGDDGRPEWRVTLPMRTNKPEARIVGDRMVATWVGHATVLVQTAGLNILTDPVWSERAGPFGFGPKRVVAPGIAFADLPKIDLIVVSHNHYDHLDLATLKRLWERDRPLIVTALGNDAILRSAGIEATAVDWGGSVPVRPQAGAAPVRVHVTRNHHWSSRWFTDRNRALWSSFVVTLPGGNLFFAGDTGFGDGRWADEAAALGPIRLALIPIGAFRFEPGQMRTGSHIGPVEAVEVFRRLRASRAIPIHWGTFRLSYEAWDTPPLLLDAALRCAGMMRRVPEVRGIDLPPPRDEYSDFGVRLIGMPQTIPAYAPPPATAPVSAATMTRCLDTPEVRGLR
ncbi:MBL fold metallo-hydrolase [Sphingomonas floccifaciens]|uniref:MBL fold metallo-hydrolase n=1 Tax=Sphingomonas floccifaciens TaxID=1844115 RepID=A0ABW4NCD2_9SPHN